MFDQNMVLLVMNAFRVTTFVGFLLGFTGFLIAAVFNHYELGKAIFFSGFFLGATSGILMVLTSRKESLGRLTGSLKIITSGFAVVMIGRISGFLVENAEFFLAGTLYLGLFIMFVGCIVGVFQAIKKNNHV